MGVIPPQWTTLLQRFLRAWATTRSMGNIPSERATLLQRLLRARTAPRSMGGIPFQWTTPLQRLLRAWCEEIFHESIKLSTTLLFILDKSK